MSLPGGNDHDLLVKSRAALLDALSALEMQRDAVIVVGAQAIYLRTASAPVALAEATKDSDLALDPRALDGDRRIDEAMRRAGFLLSGQPGAWANLEAIRSQALIRVSPCRARPVGIGPTGPCRISTSQQDVAEGLRPRPRFLGADRDSRATTPA